MLEIKIRKRILIQNLFSFEGLIFLKKKEKKKANRKFDVVVNKTLNFHEGKISLSQQSFKF